MPLGAVLRPQTNTVLVVRDAGPAVDLHETRTDVLASRRDLIVGEPGVLVIPRLRLRVPGPGAEGLGVTKPPHRVLEVVVEGLDVGVERRDEGPVAEAVVAVDGGALVRRGAGDGDTVRLARGGHRGQVGNDIEGEGGRHCEVASVVIFGVKEFVSRTKLGRGGRSRGPCLAIKAGSYRLAKGQNSDGWLAQADNFAPRQGESGYGFGKLRKVQGRRYCMDRERG